MSQSGKDIAIIGMSCIYPKAPDVETFWKNILSKVDATSDPPESWRAEDYFDPESDANDRVYCKRGGFIEDYAEFNPLEFGIMPSSLDGSEPDIFLALRLAREALADAGYVARPFNRKTTGVIIGRGTSFERGRVSCAQHVLMVDQTLHILKQVQPDLSEGTLARIKESLKASIPPFNADNCAWLVPNLVSGIIANRLDLQGPNFTVDAACASSLIALDIGVRELSNHTCDLVVFGGSNISAAPPLFSVFCQLGALSRTGRIRPFDKNADGTMLGEGLGMMVIKRLEDAEKDGDRIYAIVKGVGVASDGRASGALAPRLEGELLAMQRAYQASGVSQNDIGLIEAHGTGTQVGDATEIRAMTQMFGTRDGVFPRCAIGSVKSMIAHSIPAAGMAGLIKTALALYHKVLPPTLCDEPDPKMEFEKTPFYVNTETRSWVHGGAGPRRAGVSAFGFGGINTHSVLEEYNDGGDGHEARCAPLPWETEVIIIQGDSREDLVASGKRLQGFIAKNPDVELKNIAYTQNCPLQDTCVYRLAIVASSVADLDKKLGYALQRLADLQCNQIRDRSGIFFFESPLAVRGKIAFLFPGEGSQYTNMLSDLCIHFPEVRSSFELIDRIFLNRGRKILPSQVLFLPTCVSSDVRSALEDDLWTLDFAPAAVFAATRGLYLLLKKLGIEPHAIVGHSTGHDMAALASGMLVGQDEEKLLENGLEIDSINESIKEQLPVAKLLAVGASDPSAVAAMAAESGGELYVAMDNCPNQVVLCGSAASIESAYEDLKKTGAICDFVPFDRAYHTPWYRPVCEHYIRYVDRLSIQPPQLDFYSCATTHPYPDDLDEIRRIMVEQWAQPVRFRETIETMYDDGIRVFVEVGPKENLTSFVEDTLAGRSHVAVPSNSANRGGITQLNHMVGLLVAHGVAVRLDYLYTKRHVIKLAIGDDTSSMAIQDDAVKGKAKGRTVKLQLAVPYLNLDDETLEIIREERETSQQPSTPEVQPRPGAGSPLAAANPFGPESGPGGTSLCDGVGLGSYDPKRKTRIPTSTAPAGNISKSDHDFNRQGHYGVQVMEEYLDTMEKFIGQQQAIMEAYLESKNNGGKDN